MTRGNYSSDLVPPGGGDGNYVNIQAKCYENDSKQSGIIAFWQIYIYSLPATRGIRALCTSKMQLGAILAHHTVKIPTVFC